ncbi:2-succinyl-6-hydroxy-2,4-cyclohexadiene-1-carboxylate synthase [Bacillus sp. HMF5848]|uniref:2-succinyl-6-hydroxy-2, 4-cyclohexadiene-1-carboxylate synthase n=1 Tax=Bacillus sp. HMF5848 TaxID=2495421 RepID=UPI000F7AF56F|nr:2-succinyl-6-hydroxy-2,4-cyclohexadiene-1-carboxylate synthase [Bacillus sp. HMF5848]RSK28279.1 2-succinyl-6-hydroxy-2,4-cyclohexadiene-1-carboxylate synthase [Bacillus sp. HMF5848]
MKDRDVAYSLDVYGNGGHALVLLHGFTGTKKTWLPFKTIWDGFTIIAIDIIGHGESDSPLDTSAYDIRMVGETIISYVKKLGFSSASILGYSMGGRLALSIACEQPDFVSSLILESSSPGLKNFDERQQRVAADELLAAEILETGIESFVNKWERLSMFESQMRLPEEKRAEIRRERLEQNPIGLANSLRGMGTGSQPSYWERLHEVEVPVLLISGSLDQKFCHIQEEMNDKLPKSQHTIIEDTGHAIHVEQPEIFGTIVKEFLNLHIT